MNIIAIDHVNIQIPKSGVEDALEFYSNILGFKAEQIDEYKKGVRTLFTFRLGENAVLHIRPIDDFSPPDKSNYDHFALIVDMPISEVKSKLSDANMSIMREGNPLGARGRAPAIYLQDPFGYIIEIKEKSD
ncbi:MAG TPA: VOC family protein [Halobacteriales archaeon]|uniref:VOC family protein n=1 Tax=Candidatus Hikarchaeum yamanae TaxID=2675326 RepID=UPI0017AAC8BC|nr:VOC family protein [Halobacteriales archaeon]|tara:strand:- start:82 stop:477 length:396 start_codon:yes stop_codon:yes gene_type:complete